MRPELTSDHLRAVLRRPSEQVYTGATKSIHIRLHFRNIESKIISSRPPKQSSQHKGNLFVLEGERKGNKRQTQEQRMREKGKGRGKDKYIC